MTQKGNPLKEGEGFAEGVPGRGKGKDEPRKLVIRETDRHGPSANDDTQLLFFPKSI